MKALERLLEKYEESPSELRVSNKQKSAQKWAEENHPGKWEEASELSRDALVDFEFSNGLKKYPKLAGGLLNNDPLTIAKEYVRSDSRRNRDWWKNYGAKITGVTQKEAKGLAEVKDILDEANVPTTGIKIK